jgi:hypothetical protein
MYSMHCPHPRPLPLQACAALTESEVLALRDLSAPSHTIDVFYGKWMTGTEKTAPKPRAGPPLPDALVSLGIVAHMSGSGRLVYYGTSPTGLRRGDQFDIPPRLYWRRAPGDVKVTRLARVPFTGGQVYYLRMLAAKISARTYADYRTHDGYTHETYENACRERGLLSEDAEARMVLEAAVAAGDDSSVLRTLFVQLTREGCPMGHVITDPAIWGAVVGPDTEVRASHTNKFDMTTYLTCPWYAHRRAASPTWTSGSRC